MVNTKHPNFIGKDLTRVEELFHQFYPRLRLYARSITGDEKDAEDIVQDVFMHIWKNREKLDKEKNMSAFLYKIIRNRCLNFLKHKLVEEKYVQNKFETEELYHLSLNESEDFISLEEKLHAELEKMISKMPTKCGVAFRLRWIDGKKIKEIAEIMNISTTMVDKHLAKGIEFAKNNLRNDMFLFFILFKQKDF